MILMMMDDDDDVNDNCCKSGSMEQVECEQRLKGFCGPRLRYARRGNGLAPALQRSSTRQLVRGRAAEVL